MPLFGKNKTDVQLEVDSDRVAAGEPLRVRVRVSEPDSKVQGGRVELRYRNEYRCEDRDSDGDRHTVTRTDDIVVASAPLFAGGVETGDYDVELAVPPQGPPSAQDAVEWRVNAVLDRKRGLDAEAGHDLTVVIGSEAYDDRARRSPDTQDDLPMTLEVAPRTVRPGDAVGGELTITPSSPLEARSVRVQLRRRRDHEDREYEEDVVMSVDVCGPLELGVGESRTFPIDLPVPADAEPTFEAKHNRQRWLLDGVVDRKLRGDHVVSAELNVHNA